MAERDDRLDPVFQKLIEQIVIKLQARLIGHRLISFGENAAPGNGGAKALKAQLGKELYILFVSVEKVDSFVIGVILTGDHTVRDAARHFIGASRHHIADTGTSSVHIPCALKLVCSHCAAPQKVL